MNPVAQQQPAASGGKAGHGAHNVSQGVKEIARTMMPGRDHRAYTTAQELTPAGQAYTNQNGETVVHPAPGAAGMGYNNTTGAGGYNPNAGAVGAGGYNTTGAGGYNPNTAAVRGGGYNNAGVGGYDTTGAVGGGGYNNTAVGGQSSGGKIGQGMHNIKEGIKEIFTPNSNATRAGAGATTYSTATDMRPTDMAGTAGTGNPAVYERRI